MAAGLERIAAKARCEPKLRFTSLAHHLTPERIWGSLCHIPNDSAPGCDGETVEEAKEGFKLWVDEMLHAVHHQGYHPPPIRRVYIPKPGKMEKRPLGIPGVADRALQRESAPGPIRHLRAGFSTLFVWGATGHWCAPRIGNPE